MPIAVYATDSVGRILIYNEAAATLWGRHPEIGQDLWCGSWRLYRTDGTSMRHDECPMAITLKTGQAVHGKAMAERPDGSRFAFSAYPTPLFSPTGELKGAVNALIDLSEGLSAQQAVHRLAAIVASSSDAIVGKTLDGVITNWNAAAERLFGYTAEEIIGRSILTLIPQDRQGEETDIIAQIRRGARIEHYETVRQRKDGSLVDISITVSPIIGGDGTIIGASKIARDISERKRSEMLLRQQAHRLETLNRVSRIISRDLDLDRIVQAVTDIATDLSGAQFGAFFYNVVDKSGESYMLYTFSGISHDLEGIGMPRNTPLFAPTFSGVEIVRSDDIRQDPHYGMNPPYFGMPPGHLPVVSYLAVPVVSSSGEVVGGLFFGHEEPAMFPVDTETLISAIAGQAAVAIDNARLHKAAQAEIEQRRRAEEARELLLHEIKHRVKNTLATVQAIASQSFRGAPPEESRAFVARLHALSDAHNLLTRQNWDMVDMDKVAERALRPFIDGEQQRIAVSGSDISINSDKALLLSMVLHELGTNAVKYGALSTNTGSVEIRWQLEQPDGQQVLSLEWQERGGPIVTPPTRKRFGTRMIERALRGQQGAARFEYEPEGLTCRLWIALKAPLQANGAAEP